MSDLRDQPSVHQTDTAGIAHREGTARSSFKNLISRPVGAGPNQLAGKPGVVREHELPVCLRRQRFSISRSRTDSRDGPGDQHEVVLAVASGKNVRPR